MLALHLSHLALHSLDLSLLLSLSLCVSLSLSLSLSLDLSLSLSLCLCLSVRVHIDIHSLSTVANHTLLTSHHAMAWKLNLVSKSHRAVGTSHMRLANTGAVHLAVAYIAREDRSSAA